MKKAQGEDRPLDEYCQVCERVYFGDVQVLGFGHWRHSYCRPGSEDWMRYFRALSPERQREEGKIIFRCASEKKTGAVSIVLDHPLPGENHDEA